MSKDTLIQPLVLPTDEFPPLPLDPGFAKLAQDELGNVVTPTDGFDDVVAEAIAIVDGVDSALDALGGGLLDAFAEADLIDAKPVSDTVAGFTASLVPTSSAVDDLGTLLATVTNPTPGGSGGGGTPAGAPCSVTQQFLSTDSSGATATVPYHADANTTYHVLSKTFSQGIPGVFLEHDDIPSVLTPGQSWQIKVTYAKAAPVGTKATFTMVTDAPNSPYVLCVVIVSGRTGGGGPVPPGTGAGGIPILH